MPDSLWTLAIAALSIGFLHTLFGPDHYLPFVAMSRAGRWSARKTLWVTWLCGAAHVGSSVLLGCLGIALGLAVSRLEGLEEARGGLAAWLLIGFGLAYLVWGVVRARQDHRHIHPSADGLLEIDPHAHGSELMQEALPASLDRPVRVTPWILFTIFLFGPCEPLIPLLMYPASQSSVWGMALVTVLFGLATIGTMTVMVGLLAGGIPYLRFKWLERYHHALAGGVVLACGLAVKLGL